MLLTHTKREKERHHYSLLMFCFFSFFFSSSVNVVVLLHSLFCTHSLLTFTHNNTLTQHTLSLLCSSVTHRSLIPHETVERFSTLCLHKGPPISTTTTHTLLSFESLSSQVSTFFFPFFFSP